MKELIHMNPVELYTGDPFFKDGWRKTEYRFIDDEARIAFRNLTNRIQGAFIDYDLFHHIKRVMPSLCLSQDILKARNAYTPDMFRPHCDVWAKQKSVELNYNDEGLTHAVARVRKKFSLASKVRPIPFDEVPWISDTNFGVPYFRNSQDIEDAQRKAIKGANAIRRGKYFSPFVILPRGKSSEEVRIVNGEGKSEFIVGASFFYPYFETLKEEGSCPYAGLYKRQGVSARVNSMKWNCRFILEMDYSKFDATIPSMLIRIAFNIIKDNMDLTEKEGILFDRYVAHFCQNGFLMPDGYVYYGRKGGVPSGSVFTSLIDSIVNAILIEYLSVRLAVPVMDYLVLGDDSVVALNMPVNIDRVVDILSELNIKVSKEDTKLKLSHEPIKFLGHYFELGVARREVEESIFRLCCPERPKGWNFKKFGSTDYLCGLFDKIKDYQNDNESFYNIGNVIIDSFLEPKEPWTWGNICRRDFYYYNMRLEVLGTRASKSRKSGLERAFDYVVDNSSLRTTAVL